MVAMAGLRGCAERRGLESAADESGWSTPQPSFARLDRPHKTMACRTRPRASLGSTGHTKRWPVVHGRELRSARQATQNDGLSYTAASFARLDRPHKTMACRTSVQRDES